MARAFGVIHGRDARATLKVTRRRSVSLKALVVMPSNCYSDQLFAIEDCMRGFVTEGGQFKHFVLPGIVKPSGSLKCVPTKFQEHQGL